jgi:tripartite-type tricarboxylate transporter receptor subunit TctC
MNAKSVAVLTAAVLACTASARSEEPYPSRLITVVCPLAAGTTEN